MSLIEKLFFPFNIITNAYHLNYAYNLHYAHNLNN